MATSLSCPDETQIPFGNDNKEKQQVY
jgi:hypothetical protein